MTDTTFDCLTEGKRTLAINLKHVKGQEIVRRLSKTSDVLIDPFRPGVLEKLNLGPKTLLRDNPRLIFARLTGFGQSGPLAMRAGHDINYVALSGILSMLGRSNEPPSAPINLIADFAGGGLLCALGICMAILERHRSGKGQVVDCSMVEGAAYVGSWLLRSQKLPIWGHPRGHNMLDGGAYFYNTYETKDGKYMSVGAIEPQFFSEFCRNLGLDSDLDQFSSESDAIKARIGEIFKTKSQAEWTQLFDHTDSCVYPVLDWQDAHKYPHNAERGAFVDQSKTDGVVVPTPAPRLSRTPAVSSVLRKDGNCTEQTEAILRELNFTKSQIHELRDDGVLMLPFNAKL